MKVRYAVKFSKESEIKFISHLDLMRTIQRIIRRSELPVVYSQGFNPHMDLSIAQPLSVGIYSSGEYMDIVLTEDLKEADVKDRLNAFTPGGVKIIDVSRIQHEANTKKIPQCMALIEAASYEIKIKYEDDSNAAGDMEKILAGQDWSTMKKSKSGEKLVNIRPMVKKLEFAVEDKTLKLSVLVSSGSRENLSPELLAEYIKSQVPGAKEQSFVDIQRKEMYTYSEGNLIPLYQYFKDLNW